MKNTAMTTHMISLQAGGRAREWVGHSLLRARVAPWVGHHGKPRPSAQSENPRKDGRAYSRWWPDLRTAAPQISSPPQFAAVPDRFPTGGCKTRRADAPGD